jgi:hypothetical protein
VDHQPGKLLSVHSISKLQLGNQLVEKLVEGFGLDPAGVGGNGLSAIFPVVIVRSIAEVTGIRRPNPTCPPTASCRYGLQTIV